MSESTLELLWYFVIGASVVFYAILDGFDLGVGMLHLFRKNDGDRRVFLNAIGPVWDGNEVWLVIIGGALFSGFPSVYAALFSGFYNLVMILLCGLIFRAVAIEFRSKKESKRWRSFWDVAFSIASFIIAFGVGIALGNLIEGVPLDREGNFTASLGMAFRPYPVLIGILSIAVFMMHGAIFLAMKTEGKLHEILRRWVNRTIAFFFACYLITTAITVFYRPHMRQPLFEEPWLLLFPAAAAAVLLLVPYFFKRKKDMKAFGASCLAIALLIIVFGIGSYPTLVRSTIDPQFSLTIYNAASTALTLKILLFIVAIGIPLVLAYGTCIYRIFKGKVVIDHASY